MTGGIAAGVICVAIGLYAGDWAPVVIGGVLLGLAGLLYAAGFRDGAA